jgi:ion channel-forming bestrophin family protein
LIAYNPKSWWGLIFKFHKSDTFRRLLPNMLTIAVFAEGVAYLDQRILPGHLHTTSIVHSLLGFVISLLLVFRTNTAYERWWEGRKLWGQLVNTSRNLALKLNAYLTDAHPARIPLASALADFAVGLKDHLRDQPQPVRGAITHIPNAIAAELFNGVENLRRHGDLTREQVRNLNNDLTALSDICGGCERIKKTPIPYSYNLFIKKFIFAYIVAMPFVFSPDFGYWNALFTTFMFYVLGSLEILAEEVENPFGTDANDLPMDDIAATIDRNVREILLGGRV